MCSSCRLRDGVLSGRPFSILTGIFGLGTELWGRRSKRLAALNGPRHAMLIFLSFPISCQTSSGWGQSSGGGWGDSSGGQVSPLDVMARCRRHAHRTRTRMADVVLGMGTEQRRRLGRQLQRTGERTRRHCALSQACSSDTNSHGRRRPRDGDRAAVMDGATALADR
jgi:hypothetical protein